MDIYIKVFVMSATVWGTFDRKEYCADVTLVQLHNSIGNWIFSGVRNEKVGVEIWPQSLLKLS